MTFDPGFTLRISNPDLCAIPLELREIPRWVCWGKGNAVNEDGTWANLSKKPIRPNGDWASSTNPSTWSTYEECVAACLSIPGRYWGIGFVFTDEDDIHGVDLDNCRDAGTGRIYGWAQKIMACLPTYWEVSPSGTGVHGFLRGEPLCTGLKEYGRSLFGLGMPDDGKVESYKAGRYFTVTGNMVGGIKELKSCPSGWQDVKRLVWDGDGHRITAAKEKIVNMPDAIEGKGGHNAMIAMVGEAARMIDNVGDLWDVVYWVNEAKCRPAWSQAELEHKVKDALKAKAKPEDFEKIDPASLDHLTTQQPEPKAKKDKPKKLRRLELVSGDSIQLEHLGWLWKGRIAQVGLTMLDGDPGLGKSTITADIVARLTKGQPLPWETKRHKPTKVLWLTSEEDPATALMPRLAAAGADRSMTRLLASKAGNELRLPSMADLLDELIAEHGIGFIVMDPLAGFVDPEIDLNHETSARSLLGSLCAVLERHRIACLALRHLSKNQQAKGLYRGLGSIAMTAQARSVLGVAKDKADPEDTRVLYSVKLNSGKAPAPAGYSLLDLEEPLYDHSGLFELEVARVEWLGEGPDFEPLDDAQQPGKERKTPRLDEAVDAIEGFLQSGPRDYKELAEHLELLKFNKDTIAKAQKAAGMTKTKTAVPRQYIASLPSQEDDVAEMLDSIQAANEKISKKAAAEQVLKEILSEGWVPRGVAAEAVLRRTGCCYSTFAKAAARLGIKWSDENAGIPPQVGFSPNDECKNGDFRPGSPRE